MDCSTIRLIRLLGKKWTFVLLQEISLHGNKGFNIISRRMRISPKILAQRIKELEQANIVSRKFVPLPPNSKYALTQKGQEILRILIQLRLLGEPKCTSCPYYEKTLMEKPFK